MQECEARTDITISISVKVGIAKIILKKLSINLKIKKLWKINGDCGLTCPVFGRGDCEEHQDDMLNGLVDDEGLENAIEILDEEAPEMMEYFFDHIINSK